VQRDAVTACPDCSQSAVVAAIRAANRGWTKYCGIFLLCISYVVPQSLWPFEPLTHSYFHTWRHNKISKARRSSKTFDLQTFFTKHISFTWQPQKSL
jgi:hypothetical protein